MTQFRLQAVHLCKNGWHHITYALWTQIFRPGCIISYCRRQFMGDIIPWGHACFNYEILNYLLNRSDAKLYAKILLKSIAFFFPRPCLVNIIRGC